MKQKRVALIASTLLAATFAVGGAEHAIAQEPAACLRAESTIQCGHGVAFAACDPQALADALELRFGVELDAPAHVYLLLRLPGGSYTVIHLAMDAGAHQIPGAGSLLTDLGAASTSRVIALREADPELDALAGRPADSVPEAFLLAAVEFEQARGRCAPMPGAPSPSPSPEPARSMRRLDTGGGSKSAVEEPQLDEEGGGSPAPDEDGAFIEPNIAR